MNMNLVSLDKTGAAGCQAGPMSSTRSVGRVSEQVGRRRGGNRREHPQAPSGDIITCLGALQGVRLHGAIGQRNENLKFKPKVSSAYEDAGCFREGGMDKATYSDCLLERGRLFGHRSLSKSLQTTPRHANSEPSPRKDGVPAGGRRPPTRRCCIPFRNFRNV